MALLATMNPTLADIAKRLDPNGAVATIAELLAQNNEVLDDMVWIEANGTASHRTTARTGLPQPTWRKLYQGVQPSKSTTTQVVDNTGMLEAYGEVDKSAADLNGNTAAFRLSEDKAHIQGMSHAMADTVFYGNEGIEPAQFTGLAPRYNTRLVAKAQSAINVIHGGSSVANVNCSIWLVVWSDQTVHGIYPKGSKAGLQNQDLGEQMVQNLDGSRYQAYTSHYKWDCGLSVRDWRYAVRIPNINVQTLTKDAAAGSDLIDLMTEALERVENLGMGKPAFYVPRVIRSFMRRQIRNSKNVNLSIGEVAGKKVVMFDEVPVRRCDALKTTEALVV